MGKYALYLVLAFTISMFAYTSSLRKNQFRSELVLVENHNLLQAKNIAYTVGEAALLNLNSDPDYAEKLLTLGKSNSQTYKNWIDIGGEYFIALFTDDDNIYTLKAIGKVGNDTYTAEAKLNLIIGGEEEEKTWEPDLPWGLFADEDIRLSGSATIFGSVATNTTNNKGVDLTWSTNITGSLLVGLGANIATTVNEGNKKDGNVGGSIKNLTEKVVYELPAFPNFPSKTNTIEELKIDWKNNGLILNPESYSGLYIEKIQVDGNTDLKINVGDENQVLYVGTLEINQGNITILGTGKLSIHVEDEFTMNGSSTMNKTGSQSQVFMYYSGEDDIKLAGATKFNGSIYVKDADIKLSGSGGLQGHIISGGDKIDITGNAKAYSRIVFAPYADIKVSGSGSISGSVVSKSFTASGNGSIVFADKFDSDIKDANLKVSSDNSFKENDDDDSNGEEEGHDDDDDDDDKLSKDKVSKTLPLNSFELLYWN